MIGGRWEQVGIASFTLNGCKDNSAISYTRIAYYRAWIEEQLRDNKKVPEQVPVTITLPPIDTTPPTLTYQCRKADTSCGCGLTNVALPGSQIDFQNEAVPYSWSMIVSIRMNGTNKHACSGTILSESYILTSASCVANIPSFGLSIVAGVHNYSEPLSTYRKVDQVILHPNYAGASQNHANDIAILHLSKPFDFRIDPYVTRTCLPEKSQILYPETGSSIALIGWGMINCENKTHHDVLQQARIRTIDHTSKYCYVLNRHYYVQFCAGVHEDNKSKTLIKIEKI